jgi:hypothetical protein
MITSGDDVHDDGDEDAITMCNGGDDDDDQKQFLLLIA